tara:strand:- start:258 stop:503 length:246 start_codon:yes stop_codon:yes gene_type:complete
MKKFLVFSVIGLMGACSSHQPDIKLVHEKEMYQLSRQEIINAHEECKAAGLRPVTVYTRVFVGGRPVPIAIDVSCGTKAGN